MTEQFQRAYRLVVGEPDPSGLGIGFIAETSGPDALGLQFTVELDETPTPNRAEISLTNLSADHRDWLAGQTRVPVSLEAGYLGALGLVYSGHLLSAGSVRAGVDWVTALSASDGSVDADGNDLANRTISKTWPRGTPISRVLLEVLAELKVGVGNVPAVAGTVATRLGPVLTRSLALDGPIWHEWIALCRTLGLTWSIQGGAMQVRVAPTVPAGVGPVVSPFTGLVGSVTKKQRVVTRSNSLTKQSERQVIDEVTGTCLLQSGIRPGMSIALQSEALIGVVLCTQVTHRGDFRGGEWYTEFTGAV